MTAVSPRHDSAAHPLANGASPAVIRQAYRQTIRRAAELATGQASPDDEPIEISAAKAGM